MLAANNVAAVRCINEKGRTTIIRGLHPLYARHQRVSRSAIFLPKRTLHGRFQVSGMWNVAATQFQSFGRP